MIDENALTDVLVDIFEDLKVQYQKMKLATIQIEALRETLSQIDPQFDKTYAQKLEKLQKSNAETPDSVESFYDEIIRRVKGGKVIGG